MFTFKKFETVCDLIEMEAVVIHLQSLATDTVYAIRY
jgi:hypothetical protein